MRRPLVGCLIGFSVLLAAPTASANHGQDYAKGQVDNQLGISANDPSNVDLSAVSSFNGTNPRGHVRFTFDTFDPNLVLGGEVRCLNMLAGGQALMHGDITSVRGGTFLFGNQFRVYVRDSGKFSNDPDLIDIDFGFNYNPPGLVCPTPLFLAPAAVTDGELIVHDSLSG